MIKAFLQNDHNSSCRIDKKCFNHVPDSFIKITPCTRVDLLNRERGESRAYSVASLAVKIMQRRDRHASLQPHVKIINVMFFYAPVAKHRSLYAWIFLYGGKQNRDL